ncbi:hypothetical protein Poli38472_011976 [Pythium oligandrum]|uniref:Uncharacterized protein n=1 Tax=Pythium oligandrum TaxID=41045 RepID=A0A8K1CQH3_PYTOL|nr:hypothetical protein Poli38472_011976 [Pythium oligandrum]|eukprot:TMW66860.1 hypothetical protein Poli38472_011976 [Pythium oligandrum]
MANTGGLFEKNPRSVRITAWLLAGAAFYVWYQHDKKTEREFSAGDANKWNQEVLRKTGTKSERERANEK